MRLPADVLDVSDLHNPFPHPEPFVSPLLSGERVEFLAPVPVGIDTRGEPIAVPLAGSSLLIGGAVRSGISSAARHFAAAAILDPRIDLAVFDALDMGDWDQFRPLVTDFLSGTHPNTLHVVRATLAEIAADIDHRAQQLHGPLAAAAPAGYPSCLVVVAEAERYTLDDRYGREILDGLLTIARRGPGTGYALVLTTHQPLRLARELRAAIRHRLALYATNAHNSAGALGATRRELGFDATDLPRQPGTGILRTGSDTQLLRGYHLTDNEIDLIAAMAATRRGRHSIG